MKRVVRITALSVALSSVVLASGWRIPEQSMNSMGTAGAYVAHAKGADASYFNPANMSFNDDTYQAEIDLNYIHLGGIDYTDDTTPAKNAASLSENFLVPTLFFTTKEYDGWRFGVNLVVPGGLSKRWDAAYQKAYAKEFTLEIVEFNPVVSYALLPNLSVGGGVRVLYSDGLVKNDAGTALREMEGETIEYGYNLALTYKPLKNLNLALTYRSNVDLHEEGNAKLYLSGTKVYDGGADVTVPLPAVLAAALSYTFETKTTFEIEYDRTYWSKYDTLDFNYKSAIPALLVPGFDDPKAKNWNDADAFRVSLTQALDKFEFMAGFAYDKTAVPSEKVTFELPDADAYIFSFGAKYKIDSHQTIGFGYLYDTKKDRSVANAEGGVDGTFSNATAHLLSIGYSVAF